MKKIIILTGVCFVIFFISCEKAGKVCHVSDPLTELPWLAEQIVQMETNSEGVEISKAIIKDIQKGKREDAIIISDPPLTIEGISCIYDCSGKKMCCFGGFMGELYKDYEVIKKEVIYVNP